MKYLNILTFAAVLAFAAGAAAQAVQSKTNQADAGTHYFVDNDGDGVCDYYTGMSDGTGNRQVANRHSRFSIHSTTTHIAGRLPARPDSPGGRARSLPAGRFR